MSQIKSEKEIEALKEGGKILSGILQKAVNVVKSGISTWELDQIARQEIEKARALPAFLGYTIAADVPPYPAALCTSINNEVVHGIPSKQRVLKGGDIIGLDLGIKYKGLYTDMAVTVGVGKISPKAKQLIEASRAALEAGIERVREGNTIGDIAEAVQTVAEAHGLGIIRDLGGHGVGHAVHEDPFVPNFGRRGTLQKLKTGMVLAIEPMFTTGESRINFLEDAWTVVTADGSLAAHFEHTVAVTEEGALILTV